MTRVQVYSDQARRRINSAVKQWESAVRQPSRASTPQVQATKRVRVANLTGSDFLQGSCVEYRDSLIDPSTSLSDFRNYVGVDGIVPISTADMQYGIVENVIRDTYTGFVVIEGVILAQLNVVNEGHLYAEPVVGSTQLRTTSSATHCRVIRKELGTGPNKWAYVRLSAAPPGPTLGVATFVSDGDLGVGTDEPMTISPGAISDPALEIDSNGNIVIGRDGLYVTSFVSTLTGIASLSGVQVNNQGALFTSPFTIKAHSMDALGASQGVLSQVSPAFLFALDSSRPATVGGDQWYMTEDKIIALLFAAHFTAGDALGFTVSAEFQLTSVDSSIVVEKLEMVDKAVES